MNKWGAVTRLGEIEGGKLKTDFDERYRPIFITKNAKMLEILASVEQIAKTDASVIISGESGTGKDVIARIIHYGSLRKNNSFTALNCGAIPRELVESELFGHEKGAFTGAHEKKRGSFEMAHKGTLFFDEIGEMPLEIQVKLLRAVEMHTFRRVGGSEEHNVDIRFISATNRNLREAIKKNDFREDLYYRLGVMELYVPPLRERKDDIPLLIEYFLDFFSKKYQLEEKSISKSCMQSLHSYDWPGNVRELRNVVERMIILSNGEEEMSCDHLPHRMDDQGADRVVQGMQSADSEIVIPAGSTLQKAEEILIMRTLRSVGNNISEAARILGVSRKTVHNKLNRMKSEN